MPDDAREIYERLAKVETMVENQQKIIDTMLDIASTTKSLVKQQEAANENIRLMRRDIDELRCKPAKRWDTVVTSAITATVAAVVAYFIGKTRGG